MTKTGWTTLTSLQLFICSQALSWGHSVNFKNPELHFQDTLLQFDIWKTNSIRYCVIIEDKTRFSELSIATQVEMALKVWLEKRPVKIIQVPCSKHEPKKTDLVIQIITDDRFPSHPAFYLPVLPKLDSPLSAHGSDEAGEPYSEITIKNNFKETLNGKTYQYTDFFKIAQNAWNDQYPIAFNFLSYLYDISLFRPQAVVLYSEKIHLDYRAVFHSTYRVLLHEIGHAFGLCDTPDSSFAESCDPDHQQLTWFKHPSSIMKDSNYFYLTEDDRNGIKAAFERFSRAETLGN